MELTPYLAKDLFSWLLDKEDFFLLDVRNNEEFGRFKVEGPYPFDMQNLPYMEFVEFEEQSLAKVQADKNRPVRIVCAKEGSAKYVGEILSANGWTNVRYLAGGIKSWGNLLWPKLVHDNGWQLYQFIRPGKASCSYGLIHGQEMMLFDPSRNIEFYQEFAKEKGCGFIYTMETHLQADYIAGSRYLLADTGVTMLGNENDFKGAKFAYTPLSDGQTFNFAQGGPQVRALFTPGHTPGSTSYFIDEQYMVSGDAVFVESIGRPDLGGMVEQWTGMLFDTLSKRIAPIPDSVTVLPAHYIDWDEANADMAIAADFGSIRKRNKHIYSLDTEEKLLAFIKENMRQQPPEYAEIRKVNAGLDDPDLETQEILDLGKNECAASAHG